MGPAVGQGEMRFAESLRLRDEYRTRLEEDNRETSPPLAPVAEPVSTKTQTQISDRKATAKESLKVAGRFTETLLKKLPECVTTNPVKMAFSIAKVIIEIKAVGSSSLYLEHRLTIISGGRRQQGRAGTTSGRNS
jgi:hypothetical protein